MTSEFHLPDLRIDSLLFDSESRYFIIIGHKKKKNSVIDQGFAHLELKVERHERGMMWIGANQKYWLSLRISQPIIEKILN